MEGTETALDPAYYRWDHPNLFAAEDHCGDTRKCMKMIDKAITEWVGLAFGSTIAWDSIRFVDKDWLMAWAPKARVWIETEKEYGFKALMSAWGQSSPIPFLIP